MKQAIQKILPLFIILSLLSFTALAQKAKTKTEQEIRVPMEPSYWEYDTAVADFVTHRDVKAVRTKTSDPVFLKNQQFSNGTIEYDVEMAGGGFPAVSFHLSDDKKNGDHFYLRYFGTTSPESRTTMQYAAFIDGMSIWDLTDEYQGGAKLNIPGWNHVKLVVSGKQMKVYVNDMNRPALFVPGLEGGRTEGGISFSGGQVIIANLVIRPNVVDSLSPAQGYISVYNDTRYLRNWQVSPSVSFPYGKEILPSIPLMGAKRSEHDLPDSTAKWTTIHAEDRGVVNLTRIFGSVKNSERRLAWLKTTIESDRVQERILNLGFSDEIWLFVNGQAVYIDKNYYGTPGQKFPDGRCTIENAAVKLSLKQGKNEILVGLANYFFGWGIIARLDDTEGIHLFRN